MFDAYYFLTGGTSGIGAETARVLAKRGVRVVMAVRDMKKAEMVKERIIRENPEADIILFEIDLSSLSSVARFCSQFLSQDLPLNILMYVRFTLHVTHARTNFHIQNENLIILMVKMNFAETTQEFSLQILNSPKKRLS
jgi:short-subunit dehydrogenase